MADKTKALPRTKSRNMLHLVEGVGWIYKRCRTDCPDTCRRHKWTYQTLDLQRGGRRLSGRSGTLAEDKTKRDAVAALRAAYKAFLAEADEPTVSGSGKGDLRFGDYARNWLKERATDGNRRKAMKPSTRANYAMYLDRLEPRLADKQLRQIRAADVRRALEHDAKSHKHSYDSATTRRLWTFIRAVLRSANGAVLPEATDADLVDVPTGDDRPEFEATWEREDIDAFLAAAEDVRWRALFMVLLYGGLRRGEALGLRWSDLEFHDDGVDLFVGRQTQTVAGNRVYWTTAKTPGSVREVSLPRVVADALLTWREEQVRERSEYGRDWRKSADMLADDPEDAVFTRPNGVPIRPNYLYKRIVATMKRAGVPIIRLHDLRDHAAMLMLQAGLHPSEVAATLGHTNTQMIERRYGRYNTGHRRSRAQMLAAYLGA